MVIFRELQIGGHDIDQILRFSEFLRADQRSVRGYICITALTLRIDYLSSKDVACASYQCRDLAGRQKVQEIEHRTLSSEDDVNIYTVETTA